MYVHMYMISIKVLVFICTSVDEYGVYNLITIQYSVLANMHAYECTYV